MRMARTPLAERFWQKVVRSDGCWLWVGAVDHRGYGKINAGGDCGQTLVAPRVAWVLTYGAIPPGMCVCHHCDNPACVNPVHLFVGTYADNARDCVQKGRHVCPSRTATHCVRGHLFDAANTRVVQRKNGLKRVCRACDREHRRAYRQTAKARAS